MSMPTGLDATHPVFQSRWIHAFEEDSTEGDVYRPETEAIPLSRRPRQRLELAPDGSARLWIPGSDDRPRAGPARWRSEGEEIVVTVEAEGGRPEQVLRVSIQSPTRLVVRKV
jgi:hypothetical protein